MPHPEYRNKKLFSITIKIIVCCCLFAILLLWGWHTNQRQTRVHNPPEIDHILEQHPNQDTSIIRSYEWSRTHTFQPRQYVRIIRIDQVQP